MITLGPIQWLLAVAIFLSGFNGLRLSAGMNVGDAGLAAAGVLWLVFSMLRMKKAPLHAILSFSLLCVPFVTKGFVSSRFDSGDAVEFLKFVTSFYILVYLVSNLSLKQADIRFFTTAYVLSAAVNAIVGVLDVLSLTNVVGWLQVATVNDYKFGMRAHGLTMHPNHLGMQCAMALTLLFVVTPSKEGKLSRFANGWLAMILFLGVLASGSRGALVSLIVAGVSLLIIYRRYVFRPSTVMSLMVIAVSLSIATAFLYDRQIFEAWDRLINRSEGVVESDSARIELYRTAWESFIDSPLLGDGYTSIGSAHNIYLQVLQSAGIIGLFGFLVYFLVPLIQSYKLLRRNGGDRILLGSVAAVLIFLVLGMVQNIIYMRSALIPMGFIWALLRWSRSSQGTRREAIGSGARMVFRSGAQ